MKRTTRFILALALLAAATTSFADSKAEARYLANAGVLITNGDTKIVFDPLFRNDFGTYRLLPEAIERALVAGEPPFDGIHAVFISHYHEDHFSPIDVLRLLQARPQIQLYAPTQAISQIVSVAGDDYQDTHGRVHEIALDYRQTPVTIEAETLLVEAVRIPHSGWPERRTDVENIAFRVTLDGETTVLHLGDADTTHAHFTREKAFWQRRPTHMAFPPYWFFGSDEGRTLLVEQLKPRHTVGVHVPVEMPSRPEERPAEVRDYDLFIEPGETREIENQ